MSEHKNNRTEVVLYEDVPGPRYLRCRDGQLVSNDPKYAGDSIADSIDVDNNIIDRMAAYCGGPTDYGDLDPDTDACDCYDDELGEPMC